jgi:ABC-type bacteriocin/lantibiotic exporter with double-glycine peptidase domain
VSLTSLLPVPLGVGAVAYLAMLLVLWYGGTLVIEKRLSPGTLTAFLLYTIYIATGLSVLSGLISEWLTAVSPTTHLGRFQLKGN